MEGLSSKYLQVIRTLQYNVLKYIQLVVGELRLGIIGHGAVSH
jgi:hypothetical protein